LIIFGNPKDDQPTHMIGQGRDILGQLECPTGAIVVPGAVIFQVLVFRYMPVYETV
jgi:hypothetical protein